MVESETCVKLRDDNRKKKNYRKFDEQLTVSQRSR